NPAIAASTIEQVAAAVARRMPGEDITPEQLRNRSWWEGPDVYVLVDDYDMVATSKEHPMMPLFPFLAQAVEIGLHVIVTRRRGGWRALRAFPRPPARGRCARRAALRRPGRGPADRRSRGPAPARRPRPAGRPQGRGPTDPAVLASAGPVTLRRCPVAVAPRF